MLSRTDVEVLLVPLLRHMYNMAAKDHPSFMYMLQVRVRMLQPPPHQLGLGMHGL